ncbi:MAG: alkanesulfonate transporter substrate-binding subunit, partial [Hyphomicrobiales bacterium]|nr:alkanesulfonate transporter substrate-binding subunit [Hyphomicrobiales bacterium]
AKGWAKAHKPILAAFMASVSRGASWFYDDANRDEAIEILRAVSKADRADVAATYDLYRKLEVFPVNNSLAGSSLGKIVEVLKDLGELDGAPDLKRFIDIEIAAIVK